MIGSLRWRLFWAILGAVLVAVGASLALGIVLTRTAVRDTIRADVGRQAQALAKRLRQDPSRGVAVPVGVPLGAPPEIHVVPAPGSRAPLEPAPGAGGHGVTGVIDALWLPAPSDVAVPIPSVLSSVQARRLLPGSALTALAGGDLANGTLTRDGREQIFAARRVGASTVLVTRPDVVSGDDFSRYLTALLISSGLAALIAAGAAALISRRLSAPLRRVAEASRILAAGGSPEPVPREQIAELSSLAGAFNDMASQLARAREAERSVLLSVSHELRTPLTSIRGYAEGIEDGTVAPGEAAAIVGREASRLERLVADLMALARLRQGVLEVAREDVDLGAVAGEAVERLRPQAQACGIEVRLAAPRPADAMADPGRVLQIVSNLLENAIRLTPRGGAVTVEAEPGCIRVSDQGPGIPAEDLPRAFERFHLRRRGGGSPDGAGLGLSIVGELATAMGGSAAVENLPEGGACFTIHLPSA